MDNIERNKKVQFRIYSKELGRSFIQPPDGWSVGNVSYEKDKESKDIRKKIEIDLIFVGDGAQYLRNLYYGYGVYPLCILSKDEVNVHSLSEEFIPAYSQRIDLTTFEDDRDTGEVKVKAYEGGLHDLIKNRYDDEMDIMTDYSLDGEYIGPLKMYDFLPTERNLLLKTLLEGEFTNYRINSGFWNTATIFRGRPVPFEISYSSDLSDDIRVPTLVNIDNSVASDPVDNFEVGSDMPFFFEAEEFKQLNLKIRVTVRIDRFEERHVRDDATLSIRYIKSYRDENGIQREKESETFIEFNIKDSIGNTFTTIKEIDETLEEGESLTLLYSQYTRIDRGLNTDSGYGRSYLYSKASIAVTDVTRYAPQTTKVVKPIDLFDRIVAKITGRNGLVKSDVFGVDGDFEFKVVNNGFLARNFPLQYENEDGEPLAIQFNTSFKEAFEAFDAIEPMAWTTGREKGVEVVRVEKATYTEDLFIGVDIPEGYESQVKEKCSNNDQFSKIELGHEGSLQYESVNGLDEFNGKSVFSTHLGQGVNNPYSKLSKYRFDATSYEISRRLTFSVFPYEDSEYDEDKWIHDAKDVNGTIMHRLWQDDFSARPTGIFDPDSAWNLRHSPVNLLLRGHGRAVRRCLWHDENKYIRFASSNANQNLITFVGGDSYKESGDIQIKKLPVQRVKADNITMTVKMTQELRLKFDGVNENGKRNIFGLIRYRDNGIEKYGRLVKLTDGDETKLELIKAGI